MYSGIYRSMQAGREAEREVKGYTLDAGALPLLAQAKTLYKQT